MHPHVARISPSRSCGDMSPVHDRSSGGEWSDSNGNTGLFVFTPGAGVAGSPRPAMFGTLTRVTHSYNLAAGATSPPITVPANIPVSLMGTQMVSAFVGLLRPVS